MHVVVLLTPLFSSDLLCAGVEVSNQGLQQLRCAVVTYQGQLMIIILPGPHRLQIMQERTVIAGLG